LRIGLVTSLVLASLILLSLALALYVVEVKSGVQIPQRTITTTALWVAVGIVAIYVLSRSISTRNFPTMREEKVSTLRKTVMALLSLVMVFGALDQFGINLSAYLVGLGVGAIVIGFAAQSTISNFMSGLLVVMEKTISTGDYVRVNVPGAPVEGTIEEISFLRTRVVTNDGVKVSIPNTLIIATTVSNFTLTQERPIIVFLKVLADLNTRNLKDELTEAMKKHFGEVFKVHIRGMEEDTVNIELWVNVNTSKYLAERDKVVQTVGKICRELSLKLKSLTTS
jgi:small-conductance mechanosensitive channel